MYLELKPGSGRVFIATFPFTKLDTQISTRFAKEIACSVVKTNCDRYDFFYTIRADSSIVGGPSAGGAITALTTMLLENKEVPENMAMTGTINAGGLIGPVGGIHQKILAAQEKGITTVIIPAIEESFDNQSNLSKNISYNLSVITVSTLQEALAAMQDKPFHEEKTDLKTPDEYTALMQAVANQLCERSEELLNLTSASNHTLFNSSAEYLAQSKAADGQEWWYSKASYCFSANLRLRQLQLENFTALQLEALAGEVDESISTRLRTLRERELNTFTDLQTKAIVDERLKEAASYLEEGNYTAQNVAYALERYRSAVVWSNFFSLPGQALQLDSMHVKAACEQKLGEVEERKSYLSVLFGSYFEENQELADAYTMRAEGDYALCLFKASKAKAQIDVVLAGVGLSDADYKEMIQSRLVVANNIIAREANELRFPVMGYSYYEYASALIDDDPYLAALFSSYALELSDLSIYFAPQTAPWHKVRAVLAHPFMLGFIGGVIAMLLYFVLRLPEKKPVQKKRARRKA